MGSSFLGDVQDNVIRKHVDCVFFRLSVLLDTFPEGVEDTGKNFFYARCLFFISN